VTPPTVGDVDVARIIQNYYEEPIGWAPIHEYRMLA